MANVFVQEIDRFAVKIRQDPSDCIFDARPIVESILSHGEWIHPITGQRVQRIAELMNAVPRCWEPARQVTGRYLYESAKATGEEGSLSYVPRWPGSARGLPPS